MLTGRLTPNAHSRRRLIGPGPSTLQELGFEVEMQENGSIQVTENALEVRTALARFFDFAEAAVDNVGLVTAEVDRADAPCSKACIVEFREQQNMRRRTDLLALLKQHSWLGSCEQWGKSSEGGR